MAHGSCFKARGSRLVALGQEKLGARAQGLESPRQIFRGHEPWATSREACAMIVEPWAIEPLTINNRLINESFNYLLYVSRNNYPTNVPKPARKTKHDLCNRVPKKEPVINSRRTCGVLVFRLDPAMFVWQECSIPNNTFLELTQKMIKCISLALARADRGWGSIQLQQKQWKRWLAN